MIFLALILLCIVFSTGICLTHGRLRRFFLILLPLTVSVTIFIGWWFTSNLFNAPPEDYAVALSKPVSLEVARQELDMPLPDGATNILYGQYAQWIAFEFMLKFEAPLDVCKSYAVALLERHNTNRPEARVSTDLRELTVVPDPVPPAPPLNISWFDIHNIKKGFGAGAPGSHQPMIWIDAERNLFYYRYTD